MAQLPADKKMKPTTTSADIRIRWCLWRDAAGTVSVIFTLAVIGLLSIIVAAVDFSRAVDYRAQLNKAADAAALAALASKSDHKKVARDIFQGKVAELGRDGISIDSLKVDVDAKQTRASVSFQVTMPRWSRLLGFSPVQIAGEAVSLKGTTSYLDVHFLVDASLSMARAADPNVPDPIARTFKPWEDKYEDCAFACHNVDEALRLWHQEHIYTRIDAVQDILKSFGDRLNGNPGGTKNVRYGLHTFSDRLTRISDLTSNPAAFANAISAIKLRYDTMLTSAIDQFVGEIGQGGDGSQQSPKKVMILVVEGLEENVYWPYEVDYFPGSDWPQRHPEWIGGSTGTGDRVPEACQRIKDKSVRIITVFLPPRYEGDAVTKTAARLRECASRSEDAFIASDRAALMASFDKIIRDLGKSEPLRLAQ